MATQTVLSGMDAWVSTGYPNQSHPQEPVIKARSGIANAYVWFRSPAPAGAVITQALLTLTVKNSSTGSRTVSARRANATWSASKLTWNNQPGQGPNDSTTSIGSLSNGSTVVLDVTQFVQAFANGTPNYGWRITTSSSSSVHFYGFNSSHAPKLTVTWSDNPAQPVDLAPAEGVTSLAKPHLTFTYQDLGGNTELAAVQVQVNATDSFSSPAFDSGVVETQASGLDLAETAFAGITDGQTVYWRVRARDGAGLWSTWSDSVSLTRHVKPTVAITNLGAGVAYETTPPIIWSVTGGTQKRYRVLVSKLSDVTRTIYASDTRTSTDTAFTIPAGVLEDDTDYRVRVRVWDRDDREASPGDPAYTEAFADFHLDVDATVDPPTNLTITQDGFKPYVFVEFDRETTPDRFVIIRDGRTVATRDADELFVDGTHYRYKSYGPRPNWSHRWEVRAVVNGKTSADNPSKYFATKVEGIWLVDRERDIEVTLLGDDEGTWEMEDDASVYTPIGSTQVVRIVSGMRGLSGSLSGVLMAGFGKPYSAMENDLYQIKERPYQTVQLYAGDVSMEVMLGNITLSPSPKTRAGQVFKNVSFDFWQVNQKEFDARF
jgi:hypothetical protein